MSSKKKKKKNWCLQTVVLEKNSQSPLDSKISPVNLQGNQPWVLIGRTDAEAEALVFWSSDLNRWLIGKVPCAGKVWRQKEKGVSDDEIAGWHHWCNGCELGQTLGDGEGQRGLACSVHGVTESAMTGRLNSNRLPKCKGKSSMTALLHSRGSW